MRVSAPRFIARALEQFHGTLRHRAIVRVVGVDAETFLQARPRARFLSLRLSDVSSRVRRVW